MGCSPVASSGRTQRMGLNIIPPAVDMIVSRMFAPNCSMSPTQESADTGTSNVRTVHANVSPNVAPDSGLILRPECQASEA